MASAALMALMVDDLHRRSDGDRRLQREPLAVGVRRVRQTQEPPGRPGSDRRRPSACSWRRPASRPVAWRRGRRRSSPCPETPRAGRCAGRGAEPLVVGARDHVPHAAQLAGPLCVPVPRRVTPAPGTARIPAGAELSPTPAVPWSHATTGRPPRGTRPAVGMYTMPVSNTLAPRAPRLTYMTRYPLRPVSAGHDFCTRTYLSSVPTGLPSTRPARSRRTPRTPRPSPPASR